MRRIARNVARLTWFFVVHTTPSGDVSRFIPRVIRPRPQDIQREAARLAANSLVTFVRQAEPHEVPVEERRRAEAAHALGRLPSAQLPLPGGR